MKCNYIIVLALLILIIFYCRVSGFWNTLSSLRGRLDKCVTSVSDIRVLLAEADTKLRVCEMWLLEHGKFCDNQLIVEQKDTYQVIITVV